MMQEFVHGLFRRLAQTRAQRSELLDAVDQLVRTKEEWLRDKPPANLLNRLRHATAIVDGIRIDIKSEEE
jgi:cytochrome P450